MKKRILAMVFAAVMVFGAAGCGGETKKQEDGKAMLEEMLAELQSYEADLTAEEAAAAGMFTIKDGAVVGGQENWDAFWGREADSVVICQFTMKDGAMLDYLKKLEDDTYLVVSDLSRDGYEYEGKEEYKASWYEGIRVFEDFVAVEGGVPHTVCVMTNDLTLDAEKFLQYWTEGSYEDNGVFMLYVI